MGTEEDRHLLPRRPNAVEQRRELGVRRPGKAVHGEGRLHQRGLDLHDGVALLKPLAEGFEFLAVGFEPT